MKLVIESLKPEHNRADFQSASKELNFYLRQYAMQDQKRRLNRCYVLADLDSQRIVGFYTLSITGIRRDLLTEHLSSRKLGKYDLVPAFLLGRLAVDQSYSGQGFGKLLLRNALIRAKSNEFGGLGVIVKAKDETALGFYLKNGFVRIESLTAFFSFVSNRQPTLG